jgi:type I restriction enzyme M protein
MSPGRAEPYRVLETDKKGKTKDKGWACDLVPKEGLLRK